MIDYRKESWIKAFCIAVSLARAVKKKMQFKRQIFLALSCTATKIINSSIKLKSFVHTMRSRTQSYQCKLASQELERSGRKKKQGREGR
jgi:hypothetical protein